MFTLIAFILACLYFAAFISIFRILFQVFKIVLVPYASIFGAISAFLFFMLVMWLI